MLKREYWPRRHGRYCAQAGFERRGVNSSSRPSIKIARLPSTKAPISWSGYASFTAWTRHRSKGFTSLIRIHDGHRMLLKNVRLWRQTDRSDQGFLEPLPADLDKPGWTEQILDFGQGRDVFYPVVHASFPQSVALPQLRFARRGQLTARISTTRARPCWHT